jgi:hypothetical protein
MLGNVDNRSGDALVLTLLGWGNEATVLFVVGVIPSAAIAKLFESARQEAKTRGVHRQRGGSMHYSSPSASWRKYDLLTSL